MPLAIGDTKMCSGCREVKSPVAKYFSRNRATRDGFGNTCKACMAKINRNWKYGLKSGSIEKMVEHQRSCCAICHTPTSDLVLDHCHTTNKIRALLCRNCNAGLGMFQDNRALLQCAIDYLDGYDTSKGAAE